MKQQGEGGTMKPPIVTNAEVWDQQAKAEVAEDVEFMWKMIKYCPSCGSYLPQNLNGTRTHTCRNCDWSGESLKSKYTGGQK